MATQQRHALRVLHAAVAIALWQGAFAPSASAQEADDKLAQASTTGTNVAQAAEAGAPAKKEREKKAADTASQITVTARRREELIQDVPAAVSAFSADKMEKEGKLKRIPFADRAAMKKAVDPVIAAYAKDIGADGILAKINAIK